jgi:hypothetical protein
MIFRGLICQNDNDFNAKNEALTNAIRLLTDEEGNILYPYVVYSGKNGKADIYTNDGKPILTEPKQDEIKQVAIDLGFVFTDLETSIIKRDEI